MTPINPDIKIYGWFDDADQTEASYDPPFDAPCPYCGRPINPPEDVRTTSMIRSKLYAKRSYFYRMHRTCDDTAKARGETADGRIWKMIEANGD